MIHRVLILGRWMVDFLFANNGYDIDGVLACLYDIGAPKSVMEQAENLMLSCEYNCGFTYPNTERKRAAILIGPTTSGNEFINTLVHEIYHLSVVIASEIGIDLEGEGPAYLSGNTAFELADTICELGCRHCRE